MLALASLDHSRIGTLWRAVGEDEVAAQSVGINRTAAKVSAFGIGGAIARLSGSIFSHYATHIEHSNFTVLLATFAIAHPILGGLSSLWGTVLAVIFIQGFLIEGLRFPGDWRGLLVRRAHPAGDAVAPKRHEQFAHRALVCPLRWASRRDAQRKNPCLN